MALRWLGVRWRLPTPESREIIIIVLTMRTNKKTGLKVGLVQFRGKKQSAASSDLWRVEPFQAKLGVVCRQHTTRKYKHAAVPTDSAQNVKIWRPLMTKMKRGSCGSTKRGGKWKEKKGI